MSVVHCERAEYDVYIGPGRCPRGGRPSLWANPFRELPESAAGAADLGVRREAVVRYADWLVGELDAERISLEELASLDGATLGCRCGPGPCHGEVLERASDWAARMISAPPNIYWELRPSKRGGYFA